MPNIVQIKIYSDPNSPNPTMTLPDVPWYADINALQAMIDCGVQKFLNIINKRPQTAILGVRS